MMKRILWQFEQKLNVICHYEICTFVEDRSAYRILVGKPKGNEPLERRKYRQQDFIDAFQHRDKQRDVPKRRVG